MRLEYSEVFQQSLIQYAARQSVLTEMATRMVMEASQCPSDGDRINEKIQNILIKPVPTNVGPQEYLLYLLDLQNDIVLFMEITTLNKDLESCRLDAGALLSRVRASLQNIKKILLIFD